MKMFQRTLVKTIIAMYITYFFPVRLFISIALVIIFVQQSTSFRRTRPRPHLPLQIKGSMQTISSLLSPARCFTAVIFCVFLVLLSMAPPADAQPSKIYWTDNDDGKVYRANLDGTGFETLTPKKLGIVYGIALDPAAGLMYWVNANDYFSDIRYGLDGCVESQFHCYN
jgi:hypothetical protein